MFHIEEIKGNNLKRHIGLLHLCTCHWLAPGLDPRANQRDGKMGMVKGGFPQGWGNLRDKVP